MRKIIALLVSLVASFAFFGITPAFADTSCTTDSNGVQYCNTQSTAISYGSVQNQTTSVASSDAAGKYNLAFETAKGYTTSAGCYRATSFAKVPRGAKCWIATQGGYHFTNSGVGRNGRRYYFNDYIGSKYSPSGTKFYYDTTHKSWRKQNCGNYVRFTGTLPALTVAKVALVKTFSAVSVTVKATQTATQDVHSTASCAANGSSASADAYGHGTATGTATATASASTQSQATATATNTAKGAVSTSAQAAAFAAARVDMFSGTWVSCSGTTPPPPQPQQTPPSIVNYTTLNDVDAGATSPNFCATVNIPGSDPGTLTFAATYGSFQTTTFAVAGQVQKCTTYVAPTEVPSGGRDSITVFVRDNTTGLSAQSATQSFPINTPPPPPA